MLDAPRSVLIGQPIEFVLDSSTGTFIVQQHLRIYQPDGALVASHCEIVPMEVSAAATGRPCYC